MPNLFSMFLDWLLTHLVALGFAVFVLVAVLGRAPLFGMHPGLAGDAVTGIETPPEIQPAAAVQRVPQQSEPVVEESPLEEVVPGAAGVPDEPVVEAPAPVTQARQGEGQPIFRPTLPDESDHQQFVPLSVATDIEKAALQPSAPDSVAAVAPRPQAAESGKLLEEARSSFWSGALERAEDLYLRYLAINPTDANSFGELGNLYQSMGRPADALDAYFEAGVRFKSQGDTERLAQILDLLSETQDPRAAQLRD